jgi:hypothetical protein
MTGFVRLNFTVRQDQAERLKSVENRSGLIQRLLDGYFASNEGLGSCQAGSEAKAQAQGQGVSQLSLSPVLEGLQALDSKLERALKALEDVRASLASQGIAEGRGRGRRGRVIENRERERKGEGKEGDYEALEASVARGGGPEPEAEDKAEEAKPKAKANPKAGETPMPIAGLGAGATSRLLRSEDPDPVPGDVRRLLRETYSLIEEMKSKF